MTIRDERPEDRAADALEARAGLSDQPRCVLSILVMAALAPEQFNEGWITFDDLPKYARVVSKSTEAKTAKGVNRASVRKAVDRAVDLIEERHPALHIERTTELKVARFRLVEPPPQVYQDWLFSEPGHECVLRGVWDAFVTALVQPPRNVEEATQELNETVARVLLLRGDKEEALRQIEQALPTVQRERERIALRLTRAMALIRTRSRTEAYEELVSLTASPLPKADIFDRLLEARLWMERAHCHFLLHIMGNKDAGMVEREIAKGRAWLQHARELEAGLSPTDRAHLLDLLALLRKAEGWLAQGQDRDLAFAEAELMLQRAFALWRTVWDSYGMGAALYNLGELAFTRYALDQNGASEEHIHEALGWYRASIALGNALATNKDFIFDYARVALLLTALAARRQLHAPAEATDLEREAAAHLRFAMEHASKEEAALIEWTRSRIDSIRSR